MITDCVSIGATLATETKGSGAGGSGATGFTGTMISLGGGGPSLFLNITFWGLTGFVADTTATFVDGGGTAVELTVLLFVEFVAVESCGKGSGSGSWAGAEFGNGGNLIGCECNADLLDND